MSLLLRILVITLGLSLAGFVAGWVTGVLMMVSWMAAYGVPSSIVLRGHLLIAGMFGGTLGAVLGPLAAWLLMRHVPLWLAVGGTALGTLAGAVAGLLAGSVELSFYGGFLGFAAAAVVLRVRARRGSLAPAEGPAIARAPQGM